MSPNTSVLRRRAALRLTLRAGARPLPLRVAATPAPGSGGQSVVSTPLGCAIVRRVTDAQGRRWSVRESSTAASTLTTLVYRCDDAAEMPEVRRSARPLTALGTGDLLRLLTSGA